MSLLWDGVAIDGPLKGRRIAHFAPVKKVAVLDEEADLLRSPVEMTLDEHIKPVKAHNVIYRFRGEQGDGWWTIDGGDDERDPDE